jgi:hypothetical protein
MQNMACLRDWGECCRHLVQGVLLVLRFHRVELIVEPLVSFTNQEQTHKEHLVNLGMLWYYASTFPPILEGFGSVLSSLQVGKYLYVDHISDANYANLVLRQFSLNWHEIWEACSLGYTKIFNASDLLLDPFSLPEKLDANRMICISSRLEFLVTSQWTCA